MGWVVEQVGRIVVRIFGLVGIVLLRRVFVD